MSPPELAPTDYEGPIIPVIIADTMATLRFPGERDIILPTNASPLNIDKDSSVRLVRKLNIINEYAWACAGDGTKIETLAHDVKYLSDDWRSFDRPMRKLGDLANHHRVETIGVSLKNSRVNVVSYRARSPYPHLGQCAAIGSGGNALLEECVMAGPSLDAFPAEATAFDKIIGFASALNGQWLVHELTEEVSDHWGGYLEWTIKISNN